MADFPIPFNDRDRSFSAAGGETSFATDYPIWDETDVTVIRTRASVATTLTLTTDYTVSIDPATGYGTITPVGSVLAGDTWRLKGSMTLERLSDYAQRGGWQAVLINKDFDRQIAMLQEIVRDLAAAQVSPASLPVSLANGGTGVSVANYNALLTNITATRSETGASAVSLLTKMREFVHVDDFGAVGDGTTDDRNAFQNAINALSNGGFVLLGPKTYKIGSALTVNAGVWLVGQGKYASVLSVSHATANMLTMNADSGLVGVKVIASVTRTAGVYVEVQGNSVNIIDCDFQNYYVGINVGTIGGTIRVGVRINGNEFSSPAVSAGSGAIVLSNFSNAILQGNIITGPTPGTQPDYGIRIRNGDTCKISDNNVTLHGIALYIDTPAGSSCFNTCIDNSTFDSAGTITGGSTVNSCAIVPAGNVYDTRITSCWFGLSASQSGCSIAPTGAGVVDGIVFTGCEFVDNGDCGLVVASSASKNWAVTGGWSAGNTNSGIRAATATTDFVITGHRAGNISARGANNKGISVDNAASDRYAINGCVVTGNTTIGIEDLGTGTVKRITDNVGYVTENGGTGTIASGTTSLAVTHGLARTPLISEIWVTFGENPTTDNGNVWVDNIGATQFTVNVRTNPGASNLDFGWGARLK